MWNTMQQVTLSINRRKAYRREPQDIIQDGFETLKFLPRVAPSLCIWTPTDVQSTKLTLWVSFLLAWTVC